MKFPRKIFRARTEGGFSLIELMIVVGIIGVLATLAVPRFQKFQAKSKQTEAKSNLSHIYTLQTAYHLNADTYGALTDIGFTTAGTTRYTYSLTGAATTTSYTAQATVGAGVLAGCQTGADTWTVDQAKTVTQTADGLATCD